ncbi:MAG: UDP-glucose 4-epimerase GalE, partial [Bauldia sp.]|nr:UDP-glucose 4-epimerase GalE [Bauldia sp.]
SLVANCGYGRGYSVKQVIDTVKQVSGRDFRVIRGDRRPGDAVAVVASPALIMSKFGWKPRYDDLDGIVRSALSWEAALERRNQRD